MGVKPEKKGIRALGIAECFRPGTAKSTLAGIVIRSDLIIDGFTFGETTITGDDATQTITNMHKHLNRNDINIILIGGAVLSLYNIIDIDQIHKETGVQTISITHKETQGLEDRIKHHFPDTWQQKLKAYQNLGTREKITLKTGYHLYARSAGIDPETAKKLLDKFTLQGAIPEPIRLAKLLAKAHLDGTS